MQSQWFGDTAIGSVMRRVALLSALFAWACSSRRERVAESSALNELSRIHVLADGTLLAFGGHAPTPADLFATRARILRLAPGAREAVVVHDGEGSVIDTSAPAESALFALVRAVRPGVRDVVREYWMLVSSDAGQSWTTRSLPAQDALRYVEFADRDRGWLIGHQGTFSTVDGGRSWTPVHAALQPMLRKNLMRSGDGGAIAFHHGSIEARDAALGILRSNAIGGEASIDCLARIDDARLLAIGRIGSDKAQRAFAREISWPSLALGAEVAGLPNDFLCDQAASSAGGVVLAGARLGTAGALGISNAVFRLARGDASLREVELGQVLSAAVLAIGETAQPIVGQIRSGSEGRALVIDRARLK